MVQQEGSFSFSMIKITDFLENGKLIFDFDMGYFEFSKDILFDYFLIDFTQIFSCFQQHDRG